MPVLVLKCIRRELLWEIVVIGLGPTPGLFQYFTEKFSSLGGPASSRVFDVFVSHGGLRVKFLAPQPENANGIKVFTYATQFLGLICDGFPKFKIVTFGSHLSTDNSKEEHTWTLQSECIRREFVWEIVITGLTPGLCQYFEGQFRSIGGMSFSVTVEEQERDGGSLRVKFMAPEQEDGIQVFKFATKFLSLICDGFPKFKIVAFGSHPATDVSSEEHTWTLQSE